MLQMLLYSFLALYFNKTFYLLVLQNSYWNSDSKSVLHKTFYLLVLHNSYWNSDSKIVLHTLYLTEKLKYSISLHKKKSFVLLFLLNICTHKLVKK